MISDRIWRRLGGGAASGPVQAVWNGAVIAQSELKDHVAFWHGVKVVKPAPAA